MAFQALNFSKSLPFSLLTKFLSTKNVSFTSKNYNSGGGGSSNMKVTVLGAMGATGQPLSMMLKQSPLIDELCLYDKVFTEGFAQELNHIDTMCRVTGYSNKGNLPKALANSKVVVILAGAFKSSTKDLETMFDMNAPIVRELSEAIGQYCPKALVAVATDPINSMVPLVSEALKKKGAYSPDSVFGIITTNVVRANTFASQALDLEPECVQVQIVGGHAERTIVPVLSLAQPCSAFDNEQIESIIKEVREGHKNIVKVKNEGSDNLIGAFGAARFVVSLLKGLRGHADVVECAYVRSKAHPIVKYLTTPVLLGPTGVQRNLGIPKLSDYERCLLNNAIPLINNDIKKGELYMGVQDPLPPCDPCDPNPRTLCAKDHCQKNAYCGRQ